MTSKTKFKRLYTFLTIIFCFSGILLLTLFFSFGSQSKLSVTRRDPIVQDPLIQVYFNHNQAKNANYTDPYRQITRSGDNLEEILIDGINSAQSSLDIAVQELRLPNLAKALVEQQQKGVKIRLILENTYNQSIDQLTPIIEETDDPRAEEAYQNYLALVDLNQDGKMSALELKERDAITILRQGKIPILDDTADGSKGTGLMHHKFIIIDEQAVITGSANFTLSGIHGDFTQLETRGNTNNLIKINSPEVATLFTEEFNLMWGDGVGGQPDSLFGVKKPFRPTQLVTVGETRIQIKFSPDSTTIPWENTSNGLINQQLQQADTSIQLALFVFSDQLLADALEKQQQKGVNIQALIDAGFAFRNYSEGLDMLGVALSNNCQYELNNHPWTNPLTTVGISQLPKGDKLHHKFAVIDQNTVITGSHNWSNAANHNNDETVLILKNPLIAEHYQQEFNDLYETAILGLPKTLLSKIEKDQQDCSTFTTPSSPVTNQIININTATQAELETLPGVGEKLAQRIIEERKKQPFTSLADLKRVSGIGDKKLEKMADKITW